MRFLRSPDSRLYLPAGIGSHGRSGEAPASTISNPAAWYQYEEGGTLTVTGTGLQAGVSVISIDGTPYSTSVTSSTSADVTIPGARTAGSPLRTSGGKGLTCNTGGSATWTVTAWTSVDETLCSGMYVASPTNCAGVSTYVPFSPWTDLKGVENLAQAGADSVKLQYVPVGHTAEGWNTQNVPSVYAGNSGRSFTRTAQTINATAYAVFIALNAYLDGTAQQMFLQFGGGLRKLYVPAGTTVLRWTDTPNVGGSTANISTPSLGSAGTMANWAAYSIWRDGSTGVHMERDADGEYTSVNGDDSTGTGGAMQLGPGAQSPGYATVPVLSTWTGNPTAAVRKRARNEVMILAGLA